MVKSKSPVEIDIEILYSQQQFTKLMIVEEVRYLEQKITNLFFFASINLVISLLLIWILI